MLDLNPRLPRSECGHLRGSVTLPPWEGTFQTLQRACLSSEFALESSDGHSSTYQLSSSLSIRRDGGEPPARLSRADRVVTRLDPDFSIVLTGFRPLLYHTGAASQADEFPGLCKSPSIMRIEGDSQNLVPGTWWKLSRTREPRGHAIPSLGPSVSSMSDFPTGDPPVSAPGWEQGWCGSRAARS